MMMMNVEHSVERELARETELLGKILPQCHFIHNKSYLDMNPGRRGGKPATNHLSNWLASWLDDR
jgi:hypothetical protein